MTEQVNVVGGGKLGTQLPLGKIYSQIEAESKRYEPEQFPGLVIKYSSGSPTVTLFTSGNYHIAGAKSTDELEVVFEKLSYQLEALGFISQTTSAYPEIRNRVFVENIDHELKLEAFLPELGFENTEYSPEQFPGLFYWPELGGTIILFRSGKFILTGIPDESLSMKIINNFKNRITQLINS